MRKKETNYVYVVMDCKAVSKSARTAYFTLQIPIDISTIFEFKKFDYIGHLFNGRWTKDNTNEEFRVIEIMRCTIQPNEVFISIKDEYAVYKRKDEMATLIITEGNKILIKKNIPPEKESCIHFNKRKPFADDKLPFVFYPFDIYEDERAYIMRSNTNIQKWRMSKHKNINSIQSIVYRFPREFYNLSVTPKDNIIYDLENDFRSNILDAFLDHLSDSQVEAYIHEFEEIDYDSLSLIRLTANEMDHVDNYSDFSSDIEELTD